MSEEAPLVAATIAGGDERGWRRTQLNVVAWLACVTLLFFHPLVSLFVYASSTHLHSHIVLVPFITAYLVYLRRSGLQVPYTRAVLPAALAFIAGGVALSLALSLNSPSRVMLSENDYHALMALAYVCLLWAGGFLFLGMRGMASIAFPAGFLVFLLPMPDGVTDWLEKASMVASAEAADLLFRFFGIPILREGMVFQLPNMLIQVAQECSGIRSSWVLFIVSLLASHMFLKKTWHRALFVILVFPLAILRNGFRIFVIGLLCFRVGPHMIHSMIHHRGGPLFFALSLIPLFLLIYWLRRCEAPSTVKL